MEAIAQSFCAAEPEHSASTTIETTLYELIEAINEQVQPGEDRLVVETVLDLIDTGQITFPGSMRESVSCLSLN